MKRAKLVPSLIMLCLSIAVLCFGVYSFTPISNSVGATITITASTANVTVTAYVDDDNNKNNDTAISNTYDSSNPQNLTITADKLVFDCSSASDLANVSAINLYFKVTNSSSASVGAYFLQGTISGETTLENVATEKKFNGTATSGTKENVVTATLKPYTEVPAGGTIYMNATLALNELLTEECSVSISLALNIEPFNESLVA